MTTLYTLQNQHGYFLQKKSADKTIGKGATDKASKASYMWGDGQELNKVFRTTHKDEAINMMFEAGSQDVALRIAIKEYPANNKSLPTIPSDDLPVPLAKPEMTAAIDDNVDESVETGTETDVETAIETTPVENSTESALQESDSEKISTEEHI
ncbi:hypothetical protein IMCC1989_2559 [gamma proteobacterium IMCC1989]|nr:hypothetical protein IMCC1989_2559 [gamma proteobacterium IMCC1989]